MSLPNVPYIKKQRTWINKRGKTRQIPMRIICPGLSRTGTSSMRVALWDLGYEAYHGWSLFENPPDSILWQEAMKAKFEGTGRLYTKDDFDAVLFDSDAITDIPGSLFAEELIDAYPEAKVVMTTRDIDSWFTSCLSTLIPYAHPSPLLLLLGYLDRAIGLYLPTCALILKYSYGTDFTVDGKAVYRQHCMRVRNKMLTSGREADYLEFDVKQGWEPLCRFLGREIPRDEEGNVKPFPKVNDRATFGETFQPYFRALFWRYLGWGMVGLVTVMVAVGAWWLRKSG